MAVSTLFNVWLESRASYVLDRGSSCQLEQRLCRHDFVLRGLSYQAYGSCPAKIVTRRSSREVIQSILQQLLVLFRQGSTHGVSMEAYMSL